MMDLTTSRFYSKLPFFDIDVNISRNSFDIPPERLFSVAARYNKKRRFLFVSNVLGKHVPVSPVSSIATARLLAFRYLEYKYGISDEGQTARLRDIVSLTDENFNDMEFLESVRVNMPEKSVFISFAETATALGHAVFSSFKDNSYFIHTTRENVLEMDPIFNFDEEHSHAVQHNFYATDKSVFEKSKTIIIIDDEITTGNTILNIIDKINEQFPYKEYVVLSILDWRSNKDIERYKIKSGQLGVNIDVLSLMSGDFNCILDDSEECESYTYQFSDEPYLKEENVSINKIYLDGYEYFSGCNKQDDEPAYLSETGRFGLFSEKSDTITSLTRQHGEILKNVRIGGKTLCLGYGEFMYIPMLISGFMGDDVYYHSTTRSPIIPKDIGGYAVRNSHLFKDLYDENVDFFAYNIPDSKYDDVFLFLEREVTDEKLERVKRIFINANIKRINIVIFSKINLC